MTEDSFVLRFFRSICGPALFLLALAACTGKQGQEKPIITWEPTNWPQAASVRALAIHPERPGVLVAGLNGQGVYQSTDDGRTWQATNRGLSNNLEGASDPNDPALKVRALLISRASPNRMVVGSEGGVFQTTDGGQSWQQQLAPEEWDVRQRTLFAQTQALASALTAAGEAFYVGTNAGLFVLRPGSENWQPTALTGLQTEDAVWAVWVNPGDPQQVYAGTYGKGVWASNDSGETWSAMNEGLKHPEALQVNKLVGDDAGRLFAGTWGDGVYVWQGQAWTPIAEGLPAGSHVWSLSFDPKTGNLFAGVRDHLTYVRRGDGPWQPTGLGMGAWTLVRDERSRRLYAGTNNQGVARSADNGDTWEVLPLTGAAGVRALLFAANTLFAGTENRGLYATTDGGQTWERRSQGFSPKADQVWALAASSNDKNMVLAGTFGDGVYLSTDAGRTWTPLAPDSLQHPDPDAQPGGAKQIISLAVLPWEGRERLLAGTQSAGLFMYDPLAGAWVFVEGLSSQAGLGATVASLVVGPDGYLYAAVSGAGVFRSQDGGGQWELASREVYFGKELAAAPRAGLQTWFHGPDRLYTRTFDGLYGSSTGENWQRLISGDFGAIAADLTHPQLAYMGVMTTTVSSTALTPTFASLLSLNNGRTWQEAGAIAAPITVLAAAPRQKGIIYAGTTAGVYKGTVKYPLLWREIAAWIALLVPLLLALAFVTYAYFALARPYGLPLVAALDLLLFRRRTLAVALAEPSALSPLEQLILIEADRPPWLPETIIAALSARQAHANSAQIAAALSHLGTHLKLLRRDPDGRYRLVAPAISRILKQRTGAEAVRLAKSVREENGVYLEAREFFARAGLAVFPRGDTLLLQSSGPPPPGLEPFGGTDRVFMARLVANHRPGAEDADATLTAAASEFNEEVRQRLAFLVVVEPPDAAVYRRIADLQAQTGLHIVLISHAAIHRALVDGNISGALQMALRRARGEVNAGLLTGPIFDPLDFFDRSEWLGRLAAGKSGGKTLLLSGPPQIGKSSLAWQSLQALTDHVVAYVRAGSRNLSAAAIGRDLLAALLADGARKYPQTEWPFRSEEITADRLETILHQVDAVVEALRSQTTTPRLVLVIDDLTDGQQAAWEQWNAAVATRPQVALLGILNGRGGPGWYPEPPVLPFTLAETEAAASILAAQAGATLAPEGVIETLYRQSGGHPLLMRQLLGLALDEVQAGDSRHRALTGDHVLAAVERHIRISPLYGQWWQGWSEAEQEILLALAGGKTPSSDLPPASSGLAEWRWIEESEGAYRIAAQSLAAWLRWAVLLTATD